MGELWAVFDETGKVVDFATGWLGAVLAAYESTVQPVTPDNLMAAASAWWSYREQEGWTCRRARIVPDDGGENG